MGTHWTRERIIKEILDHEAKGRPLTIGGKGFSRVAYGAARRIFGSWRNAILAAGIPSERILTGERWTPARIIAQIRVLSRRRRRLSATELERRYGNLVSAARRQFGSWTKAVVAADVEPTDMQRVVRWNRERVIESILTRALRGESLVARLVEPRSLPDAAYRLYGSWSAAVAAAGLDPRLTEMPPRRRRAAGTVGRQSDDARYSAWNRERVIASIHERVREHKRVNAYAVTCDYPSLYAAAIRHFQGWDNAMRAAGLNPDAHRGRISTPPPQHRSGVHQSQGNGHMRLGGTE